SVLGFLMGGWERSSVPQGLHHQLSWLDRAFAGRALGDPRRMLSNAAEDRDEGAFIHAIDFFEVRCSLIHAPSLARSSSVIPVWLPSGIDLLRTAWVSIWDA